MGLWHVSPLCSLSLESRAKTAKTVTIQADCGVLRVWLVPKPLPKPLPKPPPERRKNLDIGRKASEMLDVRPCDELVPKPSAKTPSAPSNAIGKPRGRLPCEGRGGFGTSEPRSQPGL